MQTETFRTEVEAGFGSFFQRHGFVEEDCIQEKSMTAIFYSSARCKACIFQSSHHREINCLLAKSGTKNSIREEDGWYPYRLLLLKADVKLVPIDPLRLPPREDLLREFGRELDAHFDEAVAVLTME